MHRALRRGLAALAAAALLAGCASSPRCGEDTVVILARHAERVEGSDVLTPAGQRRGEALAHALRDAGVSAILTSDAARAVRTAAPLAEATGILPATLPGADVEAFVRALRGHRGGPVLVVGHSNTVPRIVAGLGGPALPDLGHAEYDRLLVLTLSACAAPRLVSLRYGEPAPG